MTTVHQEFRLIQDCPATLIPAGDLVTLEKDTDVIVTQALGDSITVRTPLGLFRIAPEHISHLGEEAAEHFSNKTPEQELDTESPFVVDHVWERLRACFDPEIPVNIVDLGLIYDLQAEPTDSGKQRVSVKMTLTAQGCGMGPTIAADAKAKIESLPSVESAEVEIVWDPAWNPHMISEEGRKTLGL